jgi:hypothetical protein
MSSGAEKDTNFKEIKGDHFIRRDLRGGGKKTYS